MSAELDASTDTPGRTPPLVSLTSPVMPLCARAAEAESRSPRNTPTNTRIANDRLIEAPSCPKPTKRTEQTRRDLDQAGRIIGLLWFSDGRNMRAIDGFLGCGEGFQVREDLSDFF